MAESYRYIGKDTPRKDGTEIVTGKAEYLDDIHFPNLLHGAVLRSPHPHARIKRINKTKARALDGVEAVLTYRDVPDWTFGNPPIFRILDRKVRYVGDPVALVAAKTKEIALEACGLIHVEYELLPPVFETDEAIKPGAPQLYDEIPGNNLPLGDPILGPKSMTEIVMGDVIKGFAEADIIAEGAFGYENIPNPIPPESPGAVALWEEPDKVTVWVSNQAVYLNKVVLKAIFGHHLKAQTLQAYMFYFPNSNEVNISQN